MKKHKYMKEIVILTVCIVVFVGAFCALIWIWNMYHKGQEEYEELKEYVDDPEDKTEPESDGSENETRIDFTGLKMLNPDIVAWIRCEELGLDYPIVQSADNDYYLHRTFIGEDHIAGCIFMDYRNHADFTDCKTILYGHNMKDGSMFGSLKDYSGQLGVRLYVYLPDNVKTYEVDSSANVPGDDECYRFGDTAKTESDGNGNELLLSTCTGDRTTRLIIRCTWIQDENQTGAMPEGKG